MEWWNANIDTSWKCLEHCSFRPSCQLNSGVSAFYVLYVHLINRMPLYVLNHMSPYEKLFCSPTSLEHLRTFGFLCYLSTPKQQRTMFEPKALPHVFLGYPSGQMAYKVLNVDNLQITISRGIVFHEQHFPYHYLSSPSQPPTPFFLPIATNHTPLS